MNVFHLTDSDLNPAGGVEVIEVVVASLEVAVQEDHIENMVVVGHHQTPKTRPGHGADLVAVDGFL